MKPDLYTKIILTIIAVVLSGILLKDYDIIPRAHASSDDLMNVRIKEVDVNAFTPGWPYKTQEAVVPIKTSGPDIDVHVDNIR